MTAEEWKSVTGFEGLYEVSNVGNVRSLDRTNHTGRRLKGQAIKLIIDDAGYARVGLHRDGIQKMYHVHRLVLTAFVGPPPEGMVVRHLNGTPADNVLENLAWGTTKENIADSIRHGTQRNIRKTHCPKDHPYSGDNLYVDPSGSRVCRRCKRESLARWQAENPERFRGIQRRAQSKYDAKRRGKKAA